MKVKYELWQKPIKEVYGTLRTAEENYYLADIVLSNTGELYLSRRVNFEMMTEGISNQQISKEWRLIENKIWPELLARMGKGKR